MSGARGTAAIRHEQRVAELCLAALRALSGHRDLAVRGGRIYKGLRRLPVYAPYLRTEAGVSDFRSLRGAADGTALRLRWSDEALHFSLRPSGAGAALVFDLLEQYRVESLGREWAGVRENLRHRHDAWLAQLEDEGLVDSARGLMLYAVAWMARSRVTGDPVPEEAGDRIEATRFALAPMIGTALAGLRRSRKDQAAYSKHALEIALQLGELLEAGEAERKAREMAPQAERRLEALLLQSDPPEDSEGAESAAGVRHAGIAGDSPYRVFTTVHDRVRHVGELVRDAALREHRERLDRRVAQQGANVPRLARELQAVLGHPTEEGWDSAQEEGWIDGARLAQMIAVPSERRVFRQHRQQTRLDVDVTMLIDCSGSMRTHAESIAMMADLFARALDLAGSRMEVLGFTTSGWNGGQARIDWHRAGRPAAPGRLNGLSHIVFKDAEMPWRRARAGVAGLLEQHLFREGIDGEAVQWACGRLRKRGAARQLLLVVSDACPMDSSTAQANGEWYLDDHLRLVVRREEALGTEIIGVGVGLDLTSYYARSVLVELGGRVTNAAFSELVQMMRPRRR